MDLEQTKNVCRVGRALRGVVREKVHAKVELFTRLSLLSCLSLLSLDAKRVRDERSNAGFECKMRT